MVIDLYLTLLVKLCVLLLIYQTDAQDLDRELVYDGAIFAIFFASTNSIGQGDAGTNCRSWGGNLASINSEGEDAQLFSLTNATHFQCWIGLNKHPNNFLVMGNGEYTWEDGSDSTYRKFDTSVPTLRFFKFRPNNYSLSEGWVDVNSNDNTNCYLCGKIANPRGCEFTDNGSCYRSFQVAPAVNWYDAQAGCEDWGGNLASVTSEIENMLVFLRTPIIAFDCWAGMYYTDTNGNIIWNDGSGFRYTRWNFNQMTSAPNCIHWNNGGSNVWNNDNCNTSLLECYLCKRNQTTVSISGVRYQLDSPSVFGYLFASWPGVTWNKALQECIGWGGSLASIESAAEDGTLYSLAAGNDTQCWIGLEISTRGNESIIWVDGSDRSYRNYPGQILTITSIDKYYSLRAMNGSSDGGWNALNMAETLSCFYCQKLANQRGCELTYNGSCYRTFETNTALNWNDSQSNCISWGGNLASITSQQENDFLFLRTPYSAINCWIGLSDLNNNGVFQWIDGEQFTYNNWAGGIPNSAVNSNCTQSKIGGMDEWENLECNSVTKCYICKRDVDTSLLTELQRETTYNGSLFSYYTTTAGGLFAGTTQLFFCINRGGNLATIDSAEVDQLLYDLAVSDDVECWIGLEKRIRGNETSIWADGSVSTYRNYPGQTPINDQITEFYSLRAKNGNRTSGWDGKNPRETLKCFICQIPVNIRECQFTNDGFCYRTFQLVYSTINWYDAQSNCVMWGGNLASITSEDENTLLFLRTPYRADDCWIGLISTNMNNGAYYWIDGEMFNYDMWASGAPNNIANTDDCARNKVTRMNEWNNYNCSSLMHSYICKKSSNAQFDSVPERELIYDGAIFAIFSASTNSFSQVAAVDNCISWGGNLASINSQEEDAQLFNLTNATHFQCWIGLIKHRNSVLIKGPQGYSWEDGSNSLYRNFTSGSLTESYMKFRPNNGYSSGEGWDDASSYQNTNCYLCRKLANSRGCEFTNDGFCYRTYQNDAGINWDDAQSSCEEWRGNLASVTSEAENLLLFQRTPIIAFDCWAGKYIIVNGITTWNDGNTFSYSRWNSGNTSPTTGCIRWNYEGTSNWINTDCGTTTLLNCYICKRIQTTASITGVQYETLSISMFGYFQASWPGVTWNTALQECVGWGGSLASIESAAEDGTLYGLAAGNDTQCWIGLEVSTRGNDSIIWVDGSDSSYRNYPGQIPTITSIDKYYSLRSMNGSSGGGWNALNMAETLSCFFCEKLGSFISKNTTSVSDFLANGSSLFITEAITTVLCVGPNDATLVEWYIHDQLNSNRILLTSSATGVTSYDINIRNISRSIYLTCEIDEGETYTIFVARRDSIVRVINFDETLSYTSGSSAVLYYTNASIPDSLIHWTTENVMEGDNRTFNPEFPNPFPMSLLFSVVGAGQHTLTCFYRNSPAMVLGRTDLSARDTTTVTLSYDGSQTFFNDENNPSFPNPVPINIQLPTSNVMFTCSLQECIWRIVYTNSTIRMVNSTIYTIDILSSDDAGTYSLSRTTQTGNNYMTALILINVLSIPPPITTPNRSLTSMFPTTQGITPTSNETLTDSSNPIIIILPIIIIVVFLVIIILVAVIIWCYVKRRRSSQFSAKKFSNDNTESKSALGVKPSKSSTPYVNLQIEPSIDEHHYDAIAGSKEASSNKNISETRFGTEPKVFETGSENISNSQKRSTTNYANFPDQTDLTMYTEIPPNDQGIVLEYMTIDESALVPLEGEEIPKYTNISDEKKSSPFHSNLGESKRSTKIDSPLYYTKMHSATDNIPIVVTKISAKEFSKTYAKYVKSGLGKDSILYKEFQKLNVECKEMSEILFVEATKPENNTKNTHKDIFPYDENRVVLISPSYDSDYINASWINQHQFIATMHPSKDTLRDFLHMIYQTEASMVVMLTTRKEKAQIIGGVSRRVCYWPKNTGEEFECENFICKLESSTETSAFIKNEMTLQNSLENKEHSLIQCISPIWNEDSTLVDFNYAVSLLNRIIKQKQDIPSKPIIIHCEDGIAKTGVLMTVHNAIDEMHATKVINIFNNVKKLRRTRMHVVPTLACYITCYSLLNEYCSVHL